MLILAILGTLCLFFGIMFLFYPRQMQKFANNFSRVIISIDESLFRMRIGIGICLVAIGIVCFFLIYYFIKMGKV